MEGYSGKKTSIKCFGYILFFLLTTIDFKQKQPSLHIKINLSSKVVQKLKEQNCGLVLIL